MGLRNKDPLRRPLLASEPRRRRRKAVADEEVVLQLFPTVDVGQCPAILAPPVSRKSTINIGQRFFELRKVLLARGEKGISEKEGR